MDTRASDPGLMNLQTNLRYFYELAHQCNSKCVTNFDSKNLDNEERACVQTCYQKQMNLYKSLKSIVNE